jgi:multiple sugar transport system permease protein
VLLDAGVVACGATALCLALATPAAFAVARLRGPASRWILGLSVGVSVLAAVAVASPLRLAIERPASWGSCAALVLLCAALPLPIAAWMLASVFREIPEDIYRAARVDGCGALDTFARISVPLAAPGLVTTAILVFLLAWNESLFAIALSPGAAKGPP